MIPRAVIRPGTGRGSLEATHMKLGVAGRGRVGVGAKWAWRTSVGPSEQSARTAGQDRPERVGCAKGWIDFPSFHSRSQTTCHFITKASGVFFMLLRFCELNTLIWWKCFDSQRSRVGRGTGYYALR